MDEQKKTLALGLVILLVLAGAVSVYYFVIQKKAAAPGDAKIQPADLTASEPVEKTGAGEALNPLTFPAVLLDESDPSVREFALALSSNPDFAKWLRSTELIRKFVVSVDNIANGLSPKPHVDFFAPAGGFKISRTKNGMFIDGASYARYDPAVQVFLSLDPAASARLYAALRPLFREAYRDLGYPGADFEQTLVKAMGELLETPVVDGPVKLEQKILSFAMVDETLEGLSQAQKQLLRMGPESVRAIQGKIREVAAAIGIPDSRLPGTRSYTPRTD